MSHEYFEAGPARRNQGRAEAKAKRKIDVWTSRGVLVAAAVAAIVGGIYIARNIPKAQTAKERIVVGGVALGLLGVGGIVGFRNGRRLLKSGANHKRNYERVE